MSPELFRKLAALGLSTDQMAGVLEIMETEGEARREKGRERWHRWKEKKASQTSANVSERQPTTANDSCQLVRGSARGEDNLLPIEDTGQKDKKDRSPAAPTPRQALSAVLDDEHAAAVVEHRQRLKKPLTGHGAKILAGKLGRCPEPNAAADEMIANGWLRVEPEWLDRRAGLRVVKGQGPPRTDRDRLMDVGRRMLAEERGEVEPPHWQGSTIDGQAHRRQ